MLPLAAPLVTGRHLYTGEHDKPIDSRGGFCYTLYTLVPL